MTEQADITSPLLKALRQLQKSGVPLIVERLQCGTARGGRVQLCSAGAPDILCVVNGVAFGIETKSATGGLRESQRQWHRQAARCGMAVWVVRDVESGLSIVRLHIDDSRLAAIRAANILRELR